MIEKNVDFNKSYKEQSDVILQVVRLAKKKIPDFPKTASDWGIKQMIMKYLQRKRYQKKKIASSIISEEENSTDSIREKHNKAPSSQTSESSRKVKANKKPNSKGSNRNKENKGKQKESNEENI
ncbi:unnamed protein product [Rhizophagus irregularis]|nr:unnamed protein product [Rhizophagus irregularis]CAB5365861.1 unnamed protein product [Rhizophagus irregularis]